MASFCTGSGSRSCYPCGCFTPAPAPAGPTGPAGEPAITAYGGVYSNGLSSRYITSTPQNIDMPNAMPAKDVSYDFSNMLSTYIMIELPGDYEINFSLGYDSGTAEAIFVRAGAMRNDAELPGGYIFVTSTDVTAGDNYLRLSNSFIATLGAGDRISLAMSTSGTPFSNNISYSRMTVKRLGDSAYT